MPAAGFVGVDAPVKRRRSTEASVITASVVPASAVLVVGQSLSDTADWATFTALANYATTAPGQDVSSVDITFLGTSSTASEPLGDGDLNSFAIVVSDSAGNMRSFPVIPRSVTQSAPTVLGGLSDQSLVHATGAAVVPTALAFGGADLRFAVSDVPGVSIDALTGLVTFETDLLTVQSATPITVSASNSGGSVQAGFALTVQPSLSYSAAITGLANTPAHGLTAQIGTPLTGQITLLQGGETIDHGWRLNGALIPGAEAVSYMPLAGQDMGQLLYSPRVNETEVQSPAYTIRHAPPVAGSLQPVDALAGGGDILVNLAAGFSGSNLTFLETVGWAAVSGTTLVIDDTVRNAVLTVTAVNSGGQAQADLSVTIVAATTVPGQIEAPSLALDGPGRIMATWTTDPDDGGTPISSHDLRYSTDQSNWTQVTGALNPTLLQGLPPQTLYYVQMRAVNAVGAGAWSASASVSTQAGSHTFAATRTGADLVLADLPDISLQTFTATALGDDLVVTLTGPLQTPVPRQIAVIDAANHDGTDPDTGSYDVQIFDLGAGVDNTFTLAGVNAPIGALTVLLDPRADVVGGGAEEFERVVFVGASIMQQTFGSSLSQRNTTAEAAFATQGTQVEVYGHATGGFQAAQVQTLLAEAMAAFPEKTLFFVHAGGNNVTASRPYPGGQAELTTQLTGLFDIAATRPGSVVISDLTFRDYNDTTASNEAVGSKPYNDAIYLPAFQARRADLLARAYYSDGTPVSCLYEWSFETRETYLSSDNVHPGNPAGRGLLRNWLAERLAPICLGLPAPARFTRTVSAFAFTDNQDGTVALSAAGTLPTISFTDNQNGTVQRTN